MTNPLKRRMSQLLYEHGFERFQKGRYEAAIAELRKAETLFRERDARGHPFGFSLANGISGLANALALQGLCYQNLGDYQQALRCYETSLINAPFEKKRPFRVFWSTISSEVIFCYEKQLQKINSQTLDKLKQHPSIDTSLLFPFSLPKELIPLARLYELAPERYPHYSSFYTAMQKKDITIRRGKKNTDESAMKRLRIVVWGILASVWVTYGLMAARALLQKK